MYEQTLLQTGLTKDQANLYEILVKNGPSPARKIARKTTISRPLVYKVLNELTEVGLVEKKEEDGSVAVFSPSHPIKLKEYVEKKREQADNAKNALDGVFEKILSDFNLISGRPGVRFFDGLEGMKKIYEDILLTGEDFYLIRPKYSQEFAEKMVPIIQEFITERLRRKIKVTAITPNDPKARENSKNDAKFLIERVFVDSEKYNSPVEINIYGDKIAMLSYDKEFVGFIIESPQIALAMKHIFILASKGTVIP